jgi:beta-mannosidase
LDNGIIEDPFYRLNEKKQQWIDKEDWEYSTQFVVSAEEFAKENQVLDFKGLDTYAEVYLNNQKILSANNMFREWEPDVKGIVLQGENSLRIVFRSPITEGLKLLAASAYPFMASNDQSENGELGDKKVSIFTRKAGYHYGWDWGPRFVTSGIWRPIYFKAWDTARINDVYIKQPQVNKQLAKLEAQVIFQLNKPSAVEVLILDQKTNNVLATEKLDAKAGENLFTIPFEIENPKLWWSSGLGEPNLYQFRTVLKIDGKEVNAAVVQTGLRSLKLIRKKDGMGESFYFELNGIPVFAKGANYIPNDNFLPRVSKENYQKVIADAVNVNMNMLRVWGGGIYENDYFYDLCDENGLLIWQDFMFACSMYPGNAEFLENIRMEARDNIVRLRNHPSIALWCGNNEIETAWQYDKEHGGWGWKQNYTPQQRDELNDTYLKIFHEILPDEVAKNTDNDDYWPSSPMSGPNPNQHAGEPMTSGDLHYWGVWHGLHKFDQFETNIARFMSEYGFQSFPEFETVKKYALPEDYSIESEVMASHQRSGIGNLRIKEYMGWDYNVPTDFEQFLYVGQLLQARGIKAAIEAHRRAMPFCMGSLYWQINDCWPVASWSSTDYYHNWKAMHYMAKKAYMPVLVSAIEKNNNLEVTAVSDLLDNKEAQLKVTLLDFSGKELNSVTQPFVLNANTATLVKSINKNELVKNSPLSKVVAKLSVWVDGKAIAENLYYFVPPKELDLETPKIDFSVSKQNKQMVIEIKSDKLVKDIMLSIPGMQLAFSDNYFDVLPNNSYLVTVETELSSDDVKKQLQFRHLLTK